MKVLIVTHMSNASGANKSLLSIIEKLNDKVEFYVLLNEVNKDFEYELKKYGVKILYAKYSWWESQSRHGRIKQIMRFTIDALKYYKNKI